MNKTLSFILIMMCSAVIGASSLPSVTLGWDPNTEPELRGYSIYIQEDGGEYTWVADFDENELRDPLHPQVTIQGLERRDFYYFAATAYSDSAESGFSDNACGKLIPGHDDYVDCDYQEPKKEKEKKKEKSGGSGGGGGGGCFISTTRSD